MTDSRIETIARQLADARRAGARIRLKHCQTRLQRRIVARRRRGNLSALHAARRKLCTAPAENP